MSSYNFSITNNFGGTIPNYSNISYQIQTSSIAETLLSIVVDTNNFDTVVITFNNPLSSTDQATLNAICTPQPTEVPLQLQYNTAVLKGIIGAQTFTYLGDQPDEIHISKTSQTHYPSIAAAIAANNQPNVVFIVHPGTYIENNPITLPSGCSLYAEGHAENTFIVAQNPTQDLFYIGTKCKIEGFSFVGATGARGIYFDCTQSEGQGAVSVIFECYVTDCNIGIEVDGKGITAGADTLYGREVKVNTATRSINYGVYTHSGGQFISESLIMNGIPGYFTINNAIYVTDSGSKSSSTTTSIWYCNVALEIDNGGEAEVSLLTSQYNNIGVQFGASGTTSKIDASLLNIQHSITYDLNILCTNANIGIQSGNIDVSKVNNPNNVNLNAKFTSQQFSTYYYNNTGQVNFGSKAIPSSMSIGQGTYDIYGVNVFLNTNLTTGTWTDITEGAIGEIPPFNLFSTTTPGGCLYIGRDDNPVGIYVQISTGTTSTTQKTDLTWEYWNGSVWTSFTIWQCYTNPPFYTPTSSFLSVPGTYHVRFGINDNTPIVATTLNGQTKYWVRARIVNALSSIPVGQFLKFHVNSDQIDNDGFIEYFGNARNIENMHHWNQKLMYASSNNLGSTGLFLSSDLGFISNNAVFAAGILSRVGINGFVPKDADLSFPVRIDVSLVGDGTTGGNVNLTARWNKTNSGSNIYFGSTGTGAPVTSASEFNQSLIISMGNNNIETRGTFYLNFCTVITNPSSGTPDLVWLSIERDASGANPLDTYTGNIIVMQYDVSYIKMYNGGHILSY